MSVKERQHPPVSQDTKFFPSQPGGQQLHALCQHAYGTILITSSRIGSHHRSYHNPFTSLIDAHHEVHLNVFYYTLVVLTKTETGPSFSTYSQSAQVLLVPGTHAQGSRMLHNICRWPLQPGQELHTDVPILIYVPESSSSGNCINCTRILCTYSTGGMQWAQHPGTVVH